MTILSLNFLVEKCFDSKDQLIVYLLNDLLVGMGRLLKKPCWTSWVLSFPSFFLNDLLDSQGIYCHSGHETNVEELVQ